MNAEQKAQPRKWIRRGYVCIAAFLLACLIGPFLDERFFPFALGLGAVGLIGGAALLLAGGIRIVDEYDEAYDEDTDED